MARARPVASIAPPRRSRGVLPSAIAYLALLLIASLGWEAAHVRLYTLWTEAAPGEIWRAVLHCTAGDGLLGAASLGAALLLTRAWAWPLLRFWRVSLMATLLGVVATIGLEFLSVEVLARWAYAPKMPRLPLLGTGLTPVLQWALLPPLCLWAVRKWSVPGGLRRQAPRAGAP